MVQTLQLVVHLPLLNVPFPDNAAAYLRGLAPLATYDIFWSGTTLGPDDPLELEDMDPNLDSSFY